MRVFRITPEQFASDPLSGIGAALAGGRWNTKGIRMGYTSSSRALAMMELLVHVGRDNVPDGRILLAIDIADGLIAPLKKVPNGWYQLPYSEHVQRAGDEWINARTSLALRVPSAIVPEEFNVLVNPAHPDFGRVSVFSKEPLEWDKRLFG